MGLFGFACGRCWERDCNCTPEQLKEYELECEKSRKEPIVTEYSASSPQVTVGDVVFKNSSTYFVHMVVDGIAKITSLSENVGAGKIIDLKEPYQKIVLNIEK